MAHLRIRNQPLPRYQRLDSGRAIPHFGGPHRLTNMLNHYAYKPTTIPPHQVAAVARPALPLGVAARADYDQGEPSAPPNTSINAMKTNFFYEKGTFTARSNNPAWFDHCLGSQTCSGCAPSSAASPTTPLWPTGSPPTRARTPSTFNYGWGGTERRMVSAPRSRSPTAAWRTRFSVFGPPSNRS
jgi:hypothetical protein